MRNDLVVGPVAVTPSLSIPRQTYPATNSNLALLQSYPVRFDGQLSSIQ